MVQEFAGAIRGKVPVFHEHGYIKNLGLTPGRAREVRTSS